MCILWLSLLSTHCNHSSGTIATPDSTRKGAAQLQLVADEKSSFSERASRAELLISSYNMLKLSSPLVITDSSVEGTFFDIPADFDLFFEIYVYDAEDRLIYHGSTCDKIAADDLTELSIDVYPIDNPDLVFESLRLGENELAGWVDDDTQEPSYTLSAANELYRLINGAAAEYVNNGLISAMIQYIRNDAGQGMRIYTMDFGHAEKAKAMFDLKKELNRYPDDTVYRGMFPLDPYGQDVVIADTLYQSRLDIHMHFSSIYIHISFYWSENMVDLYPEMIQTATQLAAIYEEKITGQ